MGNPTGQVCVYYDYLNLTRVELVSLKSLFFAYFVKCVLVVFIYNCVHLRQNLLKNIPFKVLRSFYEQKMRRRQGGLRRQTLTVCQEVQRSIMPFFAVKTFRVRLSSG